MGLSYLALVVLMAELLICYAIWRIWSQSAAEKRIRRMLPPKDQFTWEAVPIPAQPPRWDAYDSAEAREDSGSFETKGASRPGFANLRLEMDEIAPGALDGGVLAFSIWHSYHAIDPAFFHAITESSMGHITNLHGMDQYLGAHFFSAAAASKDGFIERLSGYVGEQKAASALEALGHKVQFAPIPNQPDWDLLVDGQPVQIKTGLSGVKDFLAHHHGIPVFTGVENADAVHDPMVHGLHNLNPEHLHYLADAGIHDLHHVFHAGVFHVPVFTVLISGFRELTLLQKQHKSVQEAAIDLAADVMGVSAGAVAGGKLGAAAGMILPGVGPVILAILGAIGGGIAGRSLAANFRLRGFHEALQNYKTVVEGSNTAIEVLCRDGEHAIKSIQEDEHRRFTRARDQLIRSARAKFEAVTGQYDSAYRTAVHSLPAVYDDIRENLRKDCIAAISALRPQTLWHRIFPRYCDHYRRMVDEWFTNAFQTLREEREALEGALRIGAHEAAKTASEFHRKYRFQSHVSESISHMLAAERSRCKEESEKIRARIDDEAHSLSETSRKRIGKRVEELCGRTSDGISALNAKISEAHKRLVAEGKPVGVAVPEP